jgi:acyl-CoA thioesterase FadM
MVVAGEEPQGCDIAKITSRSRKEWIDLLGKQYTTLLDSLIDKGETIAQAGTRIWTILEAIRKVFRDGLKTLDVVRRDEDAFLISANDERDKVFILSFPFRFTLGSKRILAFVAKEKKTKDSSDMFSKYYDYKGLLDVPTFQLKKIGPQGQDVLIHRIPITFKHNAQLSRSVSFPNYFFWLGDVRDYSVWPVLKRLGQGFSTGKWGMVTNNTELKILGEATVRDQIEIHLWASGNGGPANSTMELSFDFRKIIAGGNLERIAWCEQTTTWVEVLDHGSVKPVPYPDFYWKLMKEMLPKYDAPNVPLNMPEPLADFENFQENEVRYQAPSAPIIRPLLLKQIIETSLEDSNIVGNVYFANYFAWQGRVRDQFFYKLIPDYFRGIGEKGELLCLESRVDHLREAMPFDHILVILALKTWRTCSAVFHFEYFRLDPDGKRVKLAYGEHTAIWVTRNKLGKAMPTPFPKPIEKAFHQAISQDVKNAEGSLKRIE